MIVDLMRNDVGRIADIFAAIFPAGSITGAPKASTIGLLSSLEGGPRGVYCGAIGMLRPDGRSLFNVAIRTAVVDNATGALEFRVGGAVTWDSVAESEYDEALSKATFLRVPPAFSLLETMKLVEGRFVRRTQHLARLQRSARYCHTISRTLSRRTVAAMAVRRGVPLASDLANFAACSSVTFGGIGGSSGSTVASTTTGPGVASARAMTSRHAPGESTDSPVAPHALATAAKSIGCSSHPYSGLPRKTICSHLICPSELFLMTTTLTGRSYFTQVANSAISMDKPPSPTNATHCRPGYATWAAMA
jgi:hypothetical protein